MSTDSPPQATLLAACANCASWRPLAAGVAAHASVRGPEGVCVKGLAPAEGEPRCESYSMSASFERMLISRMMQDPAVIPIPLRGKAAKEARRRMRKGRG